MSVAVLTSGTLAPARKAGTAGDDDARGGEIHEFRQLTMTRADTATGGQPESSCRSAPSSAGYSKRNPARSSRAGFTRWLASIVRPAISPNSACNAIAGTGITAGLRSTRPSVAVNSAFVTGCGATVFTAPLI